MVNPFALTFAAIYYTLIGVAPIENWFPLIEDLLKNFLTMFQ